MGVPIKVEFSPALIEEVVFLGMRHVELIGGNMQLYNNYQEQRSSTYELPVEERDKVFNEINLLYFSSLGYSSLIFTILQDFPLFEKKLGLVSFVKASKRAEEGADLFVNSNDEAALSKTLLFKIIPGLFLDIENSKINLNREFMHIHDMLDPEFNYKPSLEPGNMERPEYALLQDKYRLLWQVYVDVRMSQKFRKYTPLDFSVYLERLFPEIGKDLCGRVRVKFQEKKWTHSALLELARNGVV